MQKDRPASDALKPHEVPEGAADEEPKGMPTSDRHQTETAHDESDQSTKPVTP